MFVDIDDPAGAESLVGAADRVEDAAKLAGHVIVPAVAGLGAFKFGNILTALAQSMGVPTTRVGSPIYFDADLDRYSGLWPARG